MSQQDVFAASEGDRWFERNRHLVLAEDSAWLEHDVPLRLLGLCDVRAERALELGCASGQRLEALLRMGLAQHATGTDVSAAAIGEGARRYPAVDLRRQPISDPVEGQYDLVIVNFVLHWLDRSLLSRTVANIDAALREGGHLLIGDFLPDAPRRVPYHHCEGLFTYKQDYPACFKALGFYTEVARLVFDHDDLTHPVKDVPEQRRGACVLLSKTTNLYGAS